MGLEIDRFLTHLAQLFLCRSASCPRAWYCFLTCLKKCVKIEISFFDEGDE